MREIFVAGSGTVPVSNKHPLGSGRVLARQAGLAAMRDAGCTYKDIDALYAGTVMPTSPAAVLVGKEFGLTGIPVVQVSNASASGLAAAHEALNAMEAGTADVVLLRYHGGRLQVLLIERRRDPFAGRWALPGGFVDAGETPKAAAALRVRQTVNEGALGAAFAAAHGGARRNR